MAANSNGTKQIPSSATAAALPVQSPKKAQFSRPGSVSVVAYEARNSNIAAVISLRNDLGDTGLLTQQQPSPINKLRRESRPAQLTPDKARLDSAYQVSLDANEADTESIVTPRRRKRSSGIHSPRHHKQATSPLTPQSAAILSPTTQSSETANSYFALRPSSSRELRSPALKRAPASRSANGVETSTGPPPAISTQRAFSFEVQQEASIESRLSQQNLAELNGCGVPDPSPKSAYRRPSRGRSPGDRSMQRRDSASEAASTVYPETAINMDRASKRYSLDGSRQATQRLSTQLNNTNLALQDAVSNGSSHEDLFLNMAEVVGVDDAEKQTQKARTSIPPKRLSIKAQLTDKQPAIHERRSSLHRPEIANDYRTPPSERTAPRDKTYPSTAHPLEGRHTSRLATSTSTVRQSESPSVRRSNPSSFHTRFRSTQLPTDVSMFNSSPLTARHNSFDQQEPSPPLLRTEDTTSTVSTNAPSTVWDELDDLKARIRKLEFTGRPQPSMNSSGSMERPRTAATSNTTMSSSPKRAGISPTTPGFEDTSPHPLLNSALAKAKAVMTAESYRPLEASASDALSLVKMTSSSNTPTTLERQMKRKADNMCRSLTELCIALVAASNTQLDRPPTRARSSSRDALTFRPAPSAYIQPSPDTIQARRFERSQSLDPEPTATQRVLSRLEARRTSMKIDPNNISSAQPSPQTELHLDLKTPTQSTISRTNTVLHRRHLAQDSTLQDTDLTIRPVSRAATELARANTTGGLDRASKRMSREYTSSHPLPSPHARNFSGLNHLSSSTRKILSIASSNSSSSSIGRDKEQQPVTPATPGSSRRFLTRSSVVAGNEDNGTTQPRSRLVSGGQYTTNTRSLLSGRAGDRRSWAGNGSGDEQNGQGAQF